MVLNKVHLIARQGRLRAQNVETKVAANIAGRYGCPAVDNLYNIYQVNDPIATNIACTVDRKWANEHPPVQILTLPLQIPAQLTEAKQQSKVRDVFECLTSTSSDTFHQSWSSYALKPFFKDVRESTRAALECLPKGPIEDKSKLTFAEQKILALNPNMIIDYYLPARSMTNQYLEAMSSHSSYWENSNVVRFIITELNWAKSREFRISIEDLLKEEKTS